MTYLVVIILLLLVCGIGALIALGSDTAGGAAAAVVAFVVLAGGLTLYSTYTQIPSHHEGVVSNISGVVKSAIGPGTHTVAPTDSVDVVNTGVQSYTFNDLPAVSKESQNVWITVQVNYHLDSAKIIELYRTVGANWFDTFVPGAVQQAVKEETTKYQTIELAPNRVAMGAAIELSLKKTLSPHSIYVDAVFLINVRYSDSFEQAIEQKQVASQEAQRATLKAQEKVNQAQGDKQSAILAAQGKAASTLLQAEAESKANRLLASSLNNPNLIKYELVQKLAPNVKLIVPAGNGIYSLGGLAK